MDTLLSIIVQYPLLTVIVCAMVVIVFAPLLLWYNLPRRRQERRIKQAVKKLGHKSMDSVWLPDGVDGEVFIDHLVLTDNDIKVVSVKRYPGLIYGGEQLPNWTQIVNRRSHTFPNPLDEMKLKVLAVKSVVPLAEVTGVTLFGTDSQFPTKKPDGVITIDDINTRHRSTDISPSLLSSWNALQSSHQNRV